jgi:hypothetical protein
VDTLTAPARRWIRRAAAGLALGTVCGLLAVGCAASTSVDAAPHGGGSGVEPLASSTRVASLPAAGVAALADAPRPVRVRVPALRIDAAMEPLYRDSTGVLLPPENGRAGWYEAGPEPGELGRAVLAGHVDSRTGPDVFLNLRRASAGDRVLVDLADGSTLTFVVDSVGLYAKDEFPTARVYGGPHRRAEVRLITCGGPYLRSRGGYQGNVVVFGHLVGRRG